MRNRIRLFGGKETEIFHLDNQVGAIAFIPVLNVIYYLLTLVTARGRRFALFLETVLLLAIGSLLIRLSTGWLLGAVFAHVLTCIGIGIQQ
jgi:ABC-type multidrug transport system permease subunit